MRHLLASTCLASIAIAAPLHAETVIGDKRTTGVLTSTIKAGAADDIRIGSTGSVIPATGIAVMLDSANRIINEGTVQITNADNAAGIQALAGATGSITNASGGKIVIDESYTPTDIDKDGDLDGPVAAGTARFGIRTLGGFTGDVVNNGTITIEGRNSMGVSLGGTLAGRFISDGGITVTGDQSIGIRTGTISGPVRIAGTIGATGQGAIGVSIDGDLGNALVVQGSIATTGYRNITPPADTSKLDGDDLFQGGPALRIAGSIAGGVILAVPPRDASPTDKDEDKDGIEDAKEGLASVTSFGSAAAVQIGSASGVITLGAVAGTGSGHGLVIDGTVAGLGVYSGIDANGLTIGGLGGTVLITRGMTIGGSVAATSNGASATAIRVGNGTTLPHISVTGGVSATGGNSATAKTTAIAIDAGAHVFSLSNSGTIKATAGGTSGTATAILDRSGELDLIDNSGAIIATGADAGNAIAIDLSANGSGTRIGQTVVASGVAAPSISGDVRLGGGNDVFDIADGSMTGNTSFGAGDNQLLLSGDAGYAGKAQFGAGDDIMAMGGTSSFTGTADFGGGTDRLTLTGGSRFTGTLVNAQGLTLAVNGTLDIGKSSAAIHSLSVGGTGTLGVAIDVASKTGTLYQVAGDASFAQGAKIAVRLSGIAGAEGRYTFLRAGSVSGATHLATSNMLLPYMFKSSIAAPSATELAIDVTRKTTTELGLNRSQASAYNAVFAALGKDAKVAGVYLDTVDGDAFRRQLRQMLPDHAGGTFETVTMASRATAAFLADPNAPFADQGRWGYWIQQVGWGTSKHPGDTASYDISGWGIATGAELKSDLGSFGLSFAYLFGKDADGGTDNSVNANQFEIGGYWRGYWGPVQGWLRGSWGHVDFKGRRRFDGQIGTEKVERRAEARWNGRLVSASGGASYTVSMGSFSLRPTAAVDYYRLKEKGYAETGGGDAFNLIADARTSDELAVSGAIAAGFDFGGSNEDSGWFRIEAEGGRRELISGSLGSTTARFAGGQSFTLTPEDRTSGWVGKLRAVGGGNGFRIGGEAGAEEQQGRAALSLRASLVVGL